MTSQTGAFLPFPESATVLAMHPLAWSQDFVQMAPSDGKRISFDHASQDECDIFVIDTPPK